MEKILCGFVIHHSQWRNSLLFFVKKSDSVAVTLCTIAVTGNFPCGPVAG